MAEFDLKEIVARAHFDYVGQPFPLWWGNNKTKFVLPNLKRIGQALLLGQKYFTTISLKHEGVQYNLPNEPLISLSLAKTIKQTPTVGRLRNGTVKEYITTEDYQIKIRGVCFNENEDEADLYPSDQVDTLNKLVEINDSLELVSNPFLELFGIRNIVLLNIDFDEMVGQPSIQKYIITAVSDTDFYTDLLEKNT